MTAYIKQAGSLLLIGIAAYIRNHKFDIDIKILPKGPNKFETIKGKDRVLNSQSKSSENLEPRVTQFTSP